MNRIVALGLTTFLAVVGIGLTGSPQQARGGHGWQLYGGYGCQGWHPWQRCFASAGCAGCYGCCGGCYGKHPCYGCYAACGCQGAFHHPCYGCHGGCSGCYGCYGSPATATIIVPSNSPSYSPSDTVWTLESGRDGRHANEFDGGASLANGAVIYESP